MEMEQWNLRNWGTLGLAGLRNCSVSEWPAECFKSECGQTLYIQICSNQKRKWHVSSILFEDELSTLFLLPFLFDQLGVRWLHFTSFVVAPVDRWSTSLLGGGASPRQHNEPTPISLTPGFSNRKGREKQWKGNSVEEFERWSCLIRHIRNC